MKSLLLAVVAAVAVGAGAETTTYTWDGTSTAYGDKVTVAYDGEGKVTKLTASVARDEKVVFVGGTTEFAADAVISLASVGPLVFSNRVVTAGGVTVESAVVDTVIGGEDRGFIMGVSKVLPITFADFDELRIESAVISYMSGSTQVNLDNSRFFYVTREPDRQTMQLQEFNGAWTRCVKIEMTPSDEGVVVTSVYARQTSDEHVNHVGEDFDTAELRYTTMKTELFLTKVKIVVDCNPTLRQLHFAGELEAGGAVTVSKGANVFATGAALGAQDDATCDLGVNFDNGTFTFFDCGFFTYAGTVTGNAGSLIFGSSDAEPQASQEVFLDSLTATDQTVVYGASLASLTGVTAVVRWNRYDSYDAGKTVQEDVMNDEFRGDLPAAFFRNIGDETVARFQGMSKTWGSLMNSAAVRFRQDGTNIVARAVATYDQWTGNTKVKDPWLWDAVNDNCRIRDVERYLIALSNVVLRLDCPKGDINWDTQMTLACADSSTGVSYVFKPGANRRLTAIVTSDNGMPQVKGEVHVYDRAIVTLAGRDFTKDGYTPTYQGLWQGQTGSNAAKIFVHEGGKMLTNQRAQNSGYGQVVTVDGGTYAFRDSSVSDENRDYKFKRSPFFADCIGGVTYMNGAVTDGYMPYLGAMGNSATIKVGGTTPSVCRNGYGLYSQSTESASPQTCTMDVEDVTGDDGVDFTMEWNFVWKNYIYPRLAKKGAGTVLLKMKNDLPTYKLWIREGTVLMGMTDGLGTKGVTLDGGALAIQAGLTNSISGSLVLSTNSTIRLAANSKILIDDSSAETWTAGARLTITGDPATSAISFGGKNGLTAAQLKQIRWDGKRVEFDEDGCLKQYIPGEAIIVR